MVEIFKTNVIEQHEADRLVEKLVQAIPQARVNFDLWDCDKVLRIEHAHIPIPLVCELVAAEGYACEEFPKSE